MSAACLRVLEAGSHISVQDEGRPGHLRHGISPGGAMDPLALHEGRLLVGNPPGRAALEFLGSAGRFEAVGGPLLLALSGACVSARLGEKTIAPRSGFWLEPGQVLQVGRPENGNFGYLSVAGGIDVPPVLGSRSTHVRGGFGGFEGRCLQAGDCLPVGRDKDREDHLSAASQYAGWRFDEALREPAGELRVLRGEQADLFGEREWRRFLDGRYQVTHEIDRMGARLSSMEAPLRAGNGLTVISGVIVPGSIQVPGNGRPIILLADCQPTGGYPRIATIIRADLVDFVRRPPGSELRFRLVEEEEAIAALRRQRQRLDALLEHLQPVARDPYESRLLLEKNLISGVFHSDDPEKRRPS